MSLKFQLDDENLKGYCKFISESTKRKAALPMDAQTIAVLRNQIEALRKAQTQVNTKQIELQQGFSKLASDKLQIQAEKRQFQVEQQFLTKQNKQLKARLQKIQTQHQQSQSISAGKISALQQINKQLNEKLELASHQYQSLHQKYEQLSNSQTKLKAENQSLSQSLKIMQDRLTSRRRTVNFNTLIQPGLVTILDSKAVASLLSYLQLNDLQTLLLISKRVNSRLITNPNTYKHVLQISRQKDRKRLDRAIRETKFYSLIKEKIPEQVIRVNLFRYMIARRPAGNFMGPVLNRAAQMFQSSCLANRDQISFQEELEMVIPHEDKYALLETQYHKKQDTNNDSQQQDQTDAGHDINGPKNELQARIPLTSLTQTLITEIRNESKRLDQLKQFFLIQEGLNQTIRLYLTERHQTLEQLKEQSTTLQTRLKKAAEICAAEEFNSLLQQNFIRLFVFSRLLTTQTRSLQQVMDVLMDLITNRFKHQIQRVNTIMDMQTALQTQKNSKEYFFKKSKIQQTRLLTLENQRLAQEFKMKKFSSLEQTLKQNLAAKEQDLRKLMEGVQSLRNQCKLLNSTNERLTKDLNKANTDLDSVKLILLDLNVDN